MSEPIDLSTFEPPALLAPGWYRDPAPDAAVFARRYWDGSQWTDRVSPEAPSRAAATPSAATPPPQGAPFVTPPAPQWAAVPQVSHATTPRWVVPTVAGFCIVALIATVGIFAVGRSGGSAKLRPQDRGASPARLSPHDCEAAVADATRAVPTPSVSDPVAVVRSGQLEQLPYQATTSPDGLNRYISADQYLAGTPVPNYMTWKNAMAQDGFVVAEAVGYTAGTTLFGAEALNFGSPAQALDFQRQTLDAFCARGSIQDIRRLDGVSNSVTFLRTDGSAPYRASLTIGASVVHLNACHCLETADPMGVVALWARNVAAQMAGAPN